MVKGMEAISCQTTLKGLGLVSLTKWRWGGEGIMFSSCTGGVNAREDKEFFRLKKA